MSESATAVQEGHNVIPEAVRRQARRAEELSKSASEEAAAAREAEQGEPPSPPPTVVTDPRPEADRRPQQDRQVASQGQAPSPNAQGQEPARDPARDVAYWEQRFNTLQGKYNSETATAAARLRVAEGQISTLHNTIANMHMARDAAPAPQAQSSPGAGHNSGVSAEDVESYGQEFIDRVQAWGAAKANGEISQLKQEITQLRGQTQTATTRMTQAQVETALDGQVQGWRDTNDDPLFLEWLNNADPFSGQIRLAMLNEAYTKGDVGRTANFFTAFRREQTATSPAGSQPAHTPASQGQGAGSMPLADLAAPGRGRPASPGAPADKRLWSTSQISAFYRDTTAGRYSGQEEARKRIEADIFLAGSEGRIRN